LGQQSFAFGFDCFAFGLCGSGLFTFSPELGKVTLPLAFFLVAESVYGALESRLISGRTVRLIEGALEGIGVVHYLGSVERSAVAALFHLACFVAAVRSLRGIFGTFIGSPYSQSLLYGSSA
jgi:hypothetical protein